VVKSLTADPANVVGLKNRGRIAVGYKADINVIDLEMNDVPYLLRGVKPLTTQSSVLISSSKYLNDARMREWTATIALKRNGPDMPPQAEMYEVIGILDSLRDYDELEAMLTEERRVNPMLDDWFTEDYVPDLLPRHHRIELRTADLQAAAAPDTMGIFPPQDPLFA
jgi:adenine deaminase